LRRPQVTIPNPVVPQGYQPLLQLAIEPPSIWISWGRGGFHKVGELQLLCGQGRGIAITMWPD